jgi:hypothetical protein
MNLYTPPSEPERELDCQSTYGAHSSILSDAEYATVEAFIARSSEASKRATSIAKRWTLAFNSVALAWIVLQCYHNWMVAGILIVLLATVGPMYIRTMWAQTVFRWQRPTPPSLTVSCRTVRAVEQATAQDLRRLLLVGVLVSDYSLDAPSGFHDILALRLESLLREVRPEDGVVLTPVQLKTLVGMAMYMSPGGPTSLPVSREAAIKALGVLGNRSSLPALRRARGYNAAEREAARISIAEIETRCPSGSDTMLRPASKPDSGNELLRPGTAAASEKATELLRSVDGGGTERNG